MLSYSQSFNNAIRATDREIRGYLQFNGDNTKIMRGNTGLISFTVHQDAMEEERFCIGSVCSSYCEASFFNEGIPAGVSLANSYFDAYLGVALQPPPNENTDYTVVPVVSNKTATITSGTYYLSTTSSEMSAFYGIANGGIVALTINGTTYETPMVYSSNRHEATVVDGTYTYSVYMTSSSNPLFFSAKNGTAWAAGTYTVSVEGRTYYMDYKCLGRFYITEISRGKQTTAVVAYDAVNRLSVDYVPTVTASTNGYKVLDILNDIVDQTGVNGGTHFTTTGASIYVPAIYEGTCKEQWGWLMTLCNSYGENSIGSRTDLGYIEQRAYENGKNNYTNYPALNDTVIYMDGIDAGNSFTINSLTTGTDEAPIVEGNGVGVNNYNPYIGSTQAAAIFNNLDGITYTPMTIKFRGDPCIEVMDSLKVTQDGTDYRLVVMRITTTFNGGFSQELECWGDAEAYYAMSHGQMSVIESKVTTNSTMLKEIVESIETASNGVITKILDTDGSWKELVISNNQDLSQATSVWRWNINGLAHSTAYTGGTYSFALDDQGRIIASVIQTGILKDAANKNSWNLDTGAFTITDGTINIQTSSGSFDAIKLYYGSNSVQLNPTTLLYKDSTESASVDATGFYINKLSGTSLSSLQKGGLFLVEESGNNVIRRGAFSSSGNIYQYDENEKQRTLLGVGIDGYGLYFYNTSGIHLVQFSANGLWLNDDQGDNRFEINRTGEAVVRIRNGSGVARMELNNESLIFMDGSSVQRGMYSYNGITLSNSSGTATAQYPNGVDFSSGISAYNNRATITSSDCRKWGNFRFVNIVITSAHTATNSPRMITLGSDNAPTHEHALSCVDITGGTGSVGVSVPCKVNTSGNIFMKETTSGNIYAITGFYYM